MKRILARIVIGLCIAGVLSLCAAIAWDCPPCGAWLAIIFGSVAALVWAVDNC